MYHFSNLFYVQYSSSILLNMNAIIDIINIGLVLHPVAVVVPVPAPLKGRVPRGQGS